MDIIGKMKEPNDLKLKSIIFGWNLILGNKRCRIPAIKERNENLRNIVTRKPPNPYFLLLEL